MVRFEEKLLHNALTEWIKFYIDYSALKKLLYIKGATLEMSRSPMLGKQNSWGHDQALSEPLLDQALSEPLLDSSSASDDSSDLTAVAPTPVSDPRYSRESNMGALAEMEGQTLQASSKSIPSHADSSVTSPPAGTNWSQEQFNLIRRATCQTSASPYDADLLDKAFRDQLLLELVKVDTFYNEQIRGLQCEIDILRSQAAPTAQMKQQKSKRRALLRQSSSRGSQKLNEPHQSYAEKGIEHDIEVSHAVQSPSREALAIESSKRAYADLYQKMCHLENFCILNLTAIIKILKKHDKQFPLLSMQNTLTGKSTLEILRENLAFSSFKSLNVLLAELQMLYASVFCSGDSDIARAELLLKRDTAGVMSANTFFTGFQFGMCLLLVLWIVWDVVVDFFLNPKFGRESYLRCHQADANMSLAKNTSIAVRWFEKDFPVYRGMASIIFWLWCWGISLYVWNHARINYLFMLELHPETTSTYKEVWNTASSLTLCLLASFIIHFKVVRCEFTRTLPLGVYPFIPYVYLVYKMLFPWHIRKFAWGVAFQVVCSPFYKVTFLMNFVGDVFTSLVKPITDLTYGFCFFVTGDFMQHLFQEGVCEKSENLWKRIIVPIIVLGPYWFRFMQCIRRYFDTGKRHPNLPNALKYALAMMVTIFAVFNPHLKAHRSSDDWQEYSIAWTAAYVVSTLYTFSWDIFMDWSLGKKGHYFLRPRRMFVRRYYYYAAIFADLFLRFLWTTTLIPSDEQADFSTAVPLSLAVAPFAAVAEIFRRTMWSFFRLENEHLNNTSGYRRVDRIPLHFDTPKASLNAEEKRAKGRKAIILEIAVVVIIVILVSCIAIIHP